MNEKEIEEEILALELAMQSADFWNDKIAAQNTLKKIKELKEQKEGALLYDKGNAILTIFAGAGGDDSEDFCRMLLEMYMKYALGQNWTILFLDENKNSQGGYRNITIEVQGKNAYGMLKNESGVHRLVRMSPFNSKGLRHTSFSMVEVIPIIPERNSTIRPEDIRIELSKSGGPGGQNVNKRETAVRIVHIATNIAASASGERSQEANRQKAFEMLAAKLFKIQQENHKAEVEGMQISKTTEIEWGSQIRSYVLHPYKMIKDHRTGVETSNTSKVLEEGKLDEFIEAERFL
ncbi:MAG: peptide chain release factor 2, peptide chain release factor 2 [Candidatus Parcubacteria bacterium]|jgi:peptide chain release factor 2